VPRRAHLHPPLRYGALLPLVPVVPAVTLLLNSSLAEYRGAADLTGIPEGDVKVELFRMPHSNMSGLHAGTERGVRVTHIPTGTIAVSTAGRSQLQNMQCALEYLATHQNVMRYIVNQRCTHGADCTVHPDVPQLHNFDGQEATDLPVHRIPGDKRDPR
jgi:hypothetical protein